MADKVEPRIGWTITGAAGHQLSEAIASCFVERDEALTKKWLRSEYPGIKALAQREHALISLPTPRTCALIITRAEHGQGWRDADRRDRNRSALRL